ncbi:Spy/CpxP family protein refolding chaperone [Acuticoccus sp.]|uniref:Spy/CpxP family protein refolding chaperone n=1 Tax=Acuticoccus sp. TaxID=1904378 RepID=UPI003B51D602
MEAALSNAEAEDLLNGRGMGLALAAELNGYPGPMHVLELAEELSMTAEVHQRTQALFAAMKEEAIEIGKRVVAEELTLDRLFAEGGANNAAVERATNRVGDARARLRAAHLKAHIAMRDLLTPEQVVRYEQLRGTR